MKKRNKILATLLTAIVIACAVASANAQHFTPTQKLQNAQRIIEMFYVDSVKSDKMVEDAIVAMLKTLDPHSAYSDPEETRELNEPLQGNFSGIGIQFNMATDTVYVLQTIAGGPSEKVGILSGDRIIAANDTVLAGRKMRNTEVMKHLRGPKGSTVRLKVLRKGEKEPLEFVVTRDNIPIYSVDAAYMAAPKIGYIRVSRFAESTPKEVSDAMNRLKKEGMKDLILDLEDNTGGYLMAATDLAEMLLSKGDLLVYTKGRVFPPNYYRSERNGTHKGKVVVMVNQSSASASEILSGAIQDHDRGLIVGRRTYGKGLVQRPFPMPDGSMIRLTVQRYYTPSGRCIQRHYESGNEDEYRNDLMERYKHGEFVSADSIHQTGDKYYTLRNKRTVYGGGGITPDLFVPIDTVGNTKYYRDLIGRGIVNKYVLEYVDANRQKIKTEYPTAEAFISQFNINESMLQRIVDMANADSIKYNNDQFEESKPILSVIVKGLIGRDIYADHIYYRIVNPINPVYREAVELISDDRRYNSLLKFSGITTPAN